MTPDERVRSLRSQLAEYASALEVLNQREADPDVWAGAADNASRLGELLGELGAWRLRARFDGRALAFRLALVQIGADSPDAVRPHLNAIGISLDRVRAGSGLEIPEGIDGGRLEALARPMVKAASHLDSWARTAVDTGDFRLARVLAARVVAYCDLFDDRELSDALRSLRTDNQRALAAGLERAGAAPAGLEGEAADRRLWSCTGEQLLWLIRELIERGFAPSDVHRLGAGLRDTGLYPARDLAYRCQPAPPRVFITYTWSDDFTVLADTIRSVLGYLAARIAEYRPDLDGERIDDLVYRKLGIWLDFVFIDQSARQVTEEVREVVPRALATADLHFVLSDQALLRSWCCYELAFFHVHAASGAPPAGGLRSFVARSTRAGYETFAQTMTTTPSDKAVIERAIVDRYPGGLHGFDTLLIEAAMLSDAFVARGFAQSGAALDSLRDAIDTWLTL